MIRALKPSLRQGYARSAGESKHPQLWKGLVGAWIPALGVTGNILHDISTFKNHGTLTDMDAGTDWIVDEGSWALDFAGDDDFVDISSLSPDSTIGSGDFTICGRFKTTAANSERTVVSLGKEASTNDFFSIRVDNDAGGNVMEAVVRTGGSGTVIFSTSVNVDDNLWHDFCVKRVGTTITIIIDNASFSSTDAEFGVSLFTHAYIGKFPSNIEYFNGVISNVSIYNRALTLNEIRQLHIDSLALFRLRE